MANICKSCKHNQMNICILTKEQILSNKQKCSSFETSYVQEQLFEAVGGANDLHNKRRS